MHFFFYYNFSNPTPTDLPAKWESVTKSNVNFVDIKNDGLFPSKNPFDESIQFWDNLIKKYESTESKQ